MSYRILVAGSRHARAEAVETVIADLDAELLRAALAVSADPGLGEIVLVHGACPVGGVDWIADAWAHGRHPEITVERHPAEAFGRWPSCGPVRNSHMVSLGADVCLAFPAPRSNGTWDCVRKAVRAGIYTKVRGLNR
jgi:hypothetical protein